MSIDKSRSGKADRGPRSEKERNEFSFWEGRKLRAEILQMSLSLHHEVVGGPNETLSEENFLNLITEIIRKIKESQRYNDVLSGGYGQFTEYANEGDGLTGGIDVPIEYQGRKTKVFLRFESGLSIDFFASDAVLSAKIDAVRKSEGHDF